MTDERTIEQRVQAAIDRAAQGTTYNTPWDQQHKYLIAALDTAGLAITTKEAKAAGEALRDYFDKHDDAEDAEWCMKHLPTPHEVYAALRGQQP